MGPSRRPGWWSSTDDGCSPGTRPRNAGTATPVRGPTTTRRGEADAAKDPYFDFAEVGFQIAIVLASVAMLSCRRWAFYASLILVGLAVLLTVNGFALLVAVPGLDGGH